MGYLAAHNFETVDGKGEHVSASAAEMERGGVIVREKPGPKNSLGLVKFMFPNEYDIYLHSTPQPELFNRTRRDFSHGCVRVQHPDELAVWVLQHGDAAGDWDLEKVQDAMNSGQDNHTVSLKQPIPIVIFYPRPMSATMATCTSSTTSMATTSSWKRCSPRAGRIRRAAEGRSACRSTPGDTD